MKNFLKWTVFILIAAMAMAAGMLCLTQYFDSKEPPCKDKLSSKSGKSISKPFNRHYTKLL